jgi:hypothetical protein
MKICSKCKEKKAPKEFAKDSNTKSGTRSQCKTCIKEYYLKNRDLILIKQKNQTNPEVKKIYYETRRDYIREKQKEYYDNNKSLLLEKKKDYYCKNLDKKRNYYAINKKTINKKTSEKISQRRKNDDLFKLKHNISSLIRSSFKRKKIGKKNTKTEIILGCSLSFFVQYIESKFKQGMNLSNYGKWHIDHIIPLYTAKSQEDIIKLNHYTNLQPLWAAENLSKGNKLCHKLP